MPARPPFRFSALTPAAGWRLAGLVFLIAAATAGAVAWTRGDAAPAAVIPLSRLKAQEVALERFGGRFAVEAAKFDDWFTGLWSAAALPRTLLVISLALAVGCFLVARLADDPPARG